MGYVTRETKEERLERRDADIMKRYDALSKVKVGQVQKYRYEAILSMIAYEFYLSEGYVSEIITGRLRRESSKPIQSELDFKETEEN